MKNYKINCVGMSDEQKRLVQDAFFKLGADWAGKLGQKYITDKFNHMYIDDMVLSYSSGDAFYQEDPNTKITLNELLKLANMEEHMKQKTFTKSDLKDGMVVKYRGGCVYSDKYSSLNLVVANAIIQTDEFNTLKDFNNDLTAPDYTQFDIVEVFEVVSAHRLEDIAGWGLKSIWKRPEPISAQWQAITDLEAKQLELIEAAKSIAQDIAKLKGN